MNPNGATVMEAFPPTKAGNAQSITEDAATTTTTTSTAGTTTPVLSLSSSTIAGNTTTTPSFPSPTKRESAFISGSIALQSLHSEHFEIPRPSRLQILLVIIAYVLLVTDVARSGSSLNSLPYTEIEPNVYAFDGPTVLPTLTLIKDSASSTTTATFASASGSSASSASDDSDTISSSLFKYDTSSYGMRTILFHRPALLSDWPDCLGSAYDDDCDDNLPPATVLNMLDELVNAIDVNANHTTSYKTMSDLTQLALEALNSSSNPPEVITRDYLATLPQRVRFAIRSKARFIDRASSFLSHYILDQKYWMTTWATFFNDFNSSRPGMDICLDSLDRPLFCEKAWADFALLAKKNSSAAKVGKLWNDISLRAANLQDTLTTGQSLDMAIVETETDPLTLLGGAVVLAHKLYNVVVVYRIRDCTSSSSCATVGIHEVRYEGRVIYTDAIEWRYITRTMRWAAQVYNFLRLLGLLAGSYMAIKASTAVNSPGKKSDNLTLLQRWKLTLQIFFSVPCQVVVYGSFLPVLLYASAHIIDGIIFYQVNDQRMHSIDGFFNHNGFDDMVELLSVRMRNVWVIALVARLTVFVQTSGGWTPAQGVYGLKGYLLPLISWFAIAFVLRNNSLQDSRLLESNEVEPSQTFMHIRAETLDTWKMNTYGLYNDLFALALTTAAYFVVKITLRLAMWRTQKQYTGKNAIFVAKSDVPYAAGYLWDPSALVIGWEHDLLAPLLARVVGKTVGPAAMNSSTTTSAKAFAPPAPPMPAPTAPTAAGGLARRGSAAISKDVENRYVLMNIALMSDPWTFLTLKLGSTRIYLYELSALKRKLLHPYTKPRFLREYDMKPDDVTVLGTFNVSELSWEQVITCK